MAEQDGKTHFPKLPPGERASGQDEDAELQTLLRQWRQPRSSPELNRRVLTAYRNQASETARWRRLLFRSIPVPLPIAATLLVVLIFLASRSALPRTVVRLELPTPVPSVVRVEVPVIREKVVTRTVYRQSPATNDIDKHLQNETALSTANPVSRAPQNSQTAVRLADFEPVERIQLRVLSRKGVNQ